MSPIEKSVLTLVAALGVVILAVAAASLWRPKAGAGSPRRAAMSPATEGGRADSADSPQAARRLRGEGRTGAIAGRITDANGVGVAEASVAACVFDGVPREAGTRTDAAGAFEILSLPPGIYALRASRAGIGAAVRDRVIVECDRTTDVRSVALRAGTTMELRFKSCGRGDAESCDLHPVPGTRVTFFSVHARADRVSFRLLAGEARGDARGRVVSDPLPDGRYEFTAEADGCAGTNGSFEVQDGYCSLRSPAIVRMVRR